MGNIVGMRNGNCRMEQLEEVTKEERDTKGKKNISLV